jgi:hypothetical protein
VRLIRKYEEFLFYFQFLDSARKPDVLKFNIVEVIGCGLVSAGSGQSPLCGFCEQGTVRGTEYLDQQRA